MKQQILKWLLLVGQWAGQGAIQAIITAGATGTDPLSKEGATIALTGALIAVGNHLRSKPDTGAAK